MPLNRNRFPIQTVPDRDLTLLYGAYEIDAAGPPGLPQPVDNVDPGMITCARTGVGTYTFTPTVPPDGRWVGDFAFALPSFGYAPAIAGVPLIPEWAFLANNVIQLILYSDAGAATDMLVGDTVYFTMMYPNSVDPQLVP